MSESKTPRTDAVVKPFIGSEIVSPIEASALLDFARTLELELNEANERLIQFVDSPEGKNFNAALQRDTANRLADELQAQLTTAQQDLEKIANALRTQQQRYHDLSEEAEGLKKDKERLDWLNNQPTDVEPDGDLLIWATPFTYPSAYSTGDETIRQAIDSAMKGTK